MTEETGSSDPYAAVLADLRAKRDQIDQAISVISNLLGATVGGLAPQPSPMPTADGLNDDNPTGMFLGMSIVDAAKKLLALRKRTMSNTEILAELQAGGLVLTGADPLNVVGSVLTRRFNNVGDLVRVSRGTWGLKEWYPGRNFKPANKAVAMIAEAADQESVDAVQHEKPTAIADPLSPQAIAAFAQGWKRETTHG
ncbi:winged helix-turn-helix domain-containing protein [uncultured Novosphingobium sp.]|uniref:winged helix-turn-helix domain-containing protein n=1 Tax=uncultured Novosphingobium sp. TaxID=292277 RepID=UPI00374833CE